MIDKINGILSEEQIF